MSKAIFQGPGKVKTRVAIHGVPRSGTTWLGQIIDSSPNVIYKYQPLFSYELKGFLTPQSDIRQINDFFRLLESMNTPFLDQKTAREKGLIPIFVKEEPTHLVYKEVRYHHILKNLLVQDPTIRVIGIIRNPLATLNSWLSSPREFRKDLGWNPLSEWLFAPQKNNNRPEEFYGFQKWMEVAYLFEELQNTFPKRFYVVTYERLKESTSVVTNELFGFLELSLVDQTLDFISNSKQNHLEDPYSVYKTSTKGDNWMNELDPFISDAIKEKLRGTSLEKYLL